MSPLHAILRMMPDGLFRRRMPAGHAPFFYHTISDAPLPHVRHLYGTKSVAAFERDLDFLAKNFTAVSHDDIERHMLEHQPLPEGAAALSFDDGFASCFHLARPRLLARKLPCTFFVVKNLLDNRMLMHHNKASLCVERFRTMPEAERAAKRPP